MPPFAAALSRMGLSHAEAAERLGVSTACVASWAIDRRKIPNWVWPPLAVIARERVTTWSDRAADCLTLAAEIEARVAAE